MNELINKYKEKITNYWQQLEKNQKLKLIGIIVFLVLSISTFTFYSTRTKYELTFVDLSPKDAGNIITKIEEMGVQYKLSSGGRNIAVPEAEADKVKVLLAQEEMGSGKIYSKFWDTAKFGMTDSQFSILERGAIEEELKGLITGIEGISDAQVMITMPKEKVFYSDEEQTATASVVVNIEQGVQLNPKQIKGIYNLISKSVPNLPLENITLTDQYSEPLDYMTQNNDSTDLSVYSQQRQIEKSFQQDLQKEIHAMLARIMGPDNIYVIVHAKMNFDQKKTIENLFEPVLDDNGIARSVEQIQESFSGEGSSQGGVQGTGSTQIPGYQSSPDGNGEFEHIEKRINYEVNEITKEVISSPYKLEDLGVSVTVNVADDNNPDSDAGKAKQAIRDLIKPIVLAAISDSGSNNEIIDIDSKIEVIALEFEDKQSVFENDNKWSPLYMYGGIGLAALVLGGFGYSLISRRRKQGSLEEEELSPRDIKQPHFDFNPVITEEIALQQEIQKMTKLKTDDFVKLLRTWLVDE